MNIQHLGARFHKFFWPPTDAIRIYYRDTESTGKTKGEDYKFILRERCRRRVPLAVPVLLLVEGLRLYVGATF